MGAMVSASGRRRSEETALGLAENVHNNSLENPVSYTEFRKLFIQTLGYGEMRGGVREREDRRPSSIPHTDAEWEAMARETFRIVDMDRSGAVDEWEARRVLFILQGRLEAAAHLKLLALVPIGEGRSVEDTFKDCNYSVQTLKEDTLLYRAGGAGRAVGQFFFREKPANAASLRDVTALTDDWDVGGGRSTLREVFRTRVHTVSSVTVPKGTVVYEGEAAGVTDSEGTTGVLGRVFPGGGRQIFIFRPKDLGADDWICEEEALPQGLLWDRLSYEPSPPSRAAYLGHLPLLRTHLPSPAFHKELREGSGGFGISALEHAVAGAQLEAVKMLLAANASVSHINSLRLSALSIAALCGHVHILSLLLAHQDIDANAADPLLRRSALHLAAMEGEEGAVSVLLQHPSLAVSAPDVDGVTALGHAAARNHAHVVAALLGARKSVNFEKSVNLDINAPAGPHGTTALQTAVLAGHVEVVTCLLEADASITPLPDGSSLLHAAIRAQHDQVAAAMVRMRAKESFCGLDALEGSTALVHAARQQMAATVCALVASGEAHTAWADEDETTALHIACRIGDEQMVAAIVSDRAAPLNKQNIHGYTPLYTAAALNHTRVVALLLKEEKVKLELADKHGWTPLHVTAHKGHMEVAQLLLQRKARTRPRNQGLTPLDLAATPEIRDLLLSYGGGEKGGKKGAAGTGLSPEPGG